MTQGRGAAPIGATVFGCVLLASLLAVSIFVLGYWRHTEGFRAAPEALLLSVLDEPAGRGRRLAPVGPAADHVAADPLNPRLLNAWIVAKALRGGDLDTLAGPIRVLRDLGWRNTPAVQNSIWQAARERDLPTILNSIDGLMRRQEMLGPAFQMYDQLSVEPRLQRMLVARLRGNPPWRGYYFASGGDIKDPAIMEGRVALMRALQASGDRLTHTEIAPVLPVLIAAGKADAAFAIWRNHRPARTPLDDPNFVIAGRPQAVGTLPIPFEWTLASGPGFYSDVSRDGAGTYAFFSWDGRGSPMLAAQTTSARPGRYRVSLSTDMPAREFAELIGFRFVEADGRVVPFVLQSARGGRLVFVSEAALRSGFPRFEIFGHGRRLDEPVSSGSRQYMVRQLALERLP